MNDHQPIMNFLNTISSTINTTIIKPKQPILIAISGGQDSICLFFIFIQLKKQWKWAFGILYCNHLWQKKSLCTGSLILKISYLFNISIYYVTTSDIIFNEENSRDWRYRIFYRLIFFYSYKTVTTGHTLSDKIETILFQFIRGTSPENLVSLNIAKYFSSNKKFTRNSKIKHIHFYPKKSFNLVSKPFQFVFFTKMVYSVKDLNVLLQKYNTNLSQPDWQGRYTKVMINLDFIFQKNCFNKSCMDPKLEYSIRGSRFFSLPVSFSRNAKNQRRPCFAGLSAKSKYFVRSWPKKEPAKLFFSRPTSGANSKPLRNQVANTTTWNSKLDQRSRSYPVLNTCSFEQKTPCPTFHENYRLVLKVNTTTINLKTKKKFNWKLCKKKTVISCYKILNQSMYSVLGLESTWTTRRIPTFQNHSLGLLGYEATRYKIQTKDKFIIESSKDRNIQSLWSQRGFELTKPTLVRPILMLNRFDLKKLLQFFNLPIHPDRTNQKKIYRRNRIRKELLPTLKFFFNPQIEVSFVHFSEILSDEQFYLNFLFQSLIDEFYVSTTTKFILNTSFLINIPKAFQRKLIKQLLVDCTNKDICFVHIDKILKLLQKPMREASWLGRRSYPPQRGEPERPLVPREPDVLRTWLAHRYFVRGRPKKESAKLFFSRFTSAYFGPPQNGEPERPMDQASWLDYKTMSYSGHEVPELDTVGVETNETSFRILARIFGLTNSFRAVYFVRNGVYSPTRLFLNQMPEAEQQSHTTYLGTLHKTSSSSFSRNLLFNYNTNLYFSCSLYSRLLTNQSDSKGIFFVYKPVFNKNNRSGRCLIYRNFFVVKNLETMQIYNYFKNKNRFDFEKLIQDLYRIQTSLQSRETSIHGVLTQRLKHSQASRLLFFFDIFYFQNIRIVVYFNVGVFFLEKNNFCLESLHKSVPQTG